MKQSAAPPAGAPAESKEEFQVSLARVLVNFTGLWKSCVHRECRRARECTDARFCRETYAADIKLFIRETYLPWLRQRYPTVQWGAPASVVHPQIEAALEAEKEEQARREGRASPVSVPKKEVKRQPLHDPGNV